MLCRKLLEESCCGGFGLPKVCAILVDSAWAGRWHYPARSQASDALTRQSAMRPLIDIQLLFLCFLMPPAGSYAIKYIYGGPHAADFTTMDLCLNLMLTLLGFVPGQLHAVYLLARHKRLRLALAMEMLVLQAMLLLVEAAGLRLSERVADRLQRQAQPHGPQQGQAQGQAQGQQHGGHQEGQGQGLVIHQNSSGVGSRVDADGAVPSAAGDGPHHGHLPYDGPSGLSPPPSPSVRAERRTHRFR